MTPKERLMRTLFNTEGRTHRNIKFSRGTAPDISAEDLCAEANSAISQVETGAVEHRSTFDEDYEVVRVAEL